MSLEPDDLERQVVAVWQDILGLSSLPGDMTFFEAGGTSLLAARLACRLETALQRRVSAADLFVYPTPRDLARSLHNAEAPESDNRHARVCSSELPTTDPIAADAQDRAAQQRQAFASFRPRRPEMRPA
jgi:Phosphopantetheine attachment site